MSVFAVPLTWNLSRLHPKIIAAIGREFESWVGTPWQHGQQAKGKKGGVDCTRFITGFLDNMRNEAKWKYRVLSLDTAVHAPGQSFKLLREILIHYENIEILDGQVEPGDFIWSGPAKGGPGHGYGVGQKQGLLYHCDKPTGVVRVSCSLDPLVQEKFHIYRPLNKESWVS